MLMPGRKFSSDKYRYGFNGKENDNEVKGEGNQQDYGMRVYDGRIGKFLSVDPLTIEYPELTPFQFASDRPIDGIDLDGEEHEHYTISLDEKSQKPLILKHTVGESRTNFLGFLWEMKVDHIVYVDFPSGSFGNRSFKLIGQEINTFQNWLVDPSVFKNSNGQNMELGQIFESDAARELRAINYSLITGAEMIQFAPLRNSLNVPVSKESIVSGESSPANSSANKPKEPYNRQKHYGKTPTKADRKALGTKPNEVVDHSIPLVKHYYEGDGTPGGKPGYKMTEKQRKEFAKDRSKMRNQDAKDSKKQGGEMSNYSKKMKKSNGF